MNKEIRAKTYKTRSKVFKGLGNGVILLTTLGGFFGYQAITNWEGFKAQFLSEEFTVVDPETVKLNPFFAVPLLISLVVFIFVSMKKNKEFFKGRLSIGLMITMAIFYFVYSIAVLTLSALGGALVGSIIDEVVFLPLSNKNAYKAEETKEIELEEAKETRRIIARKRAESSVADGSV